MYLHLLKESHLSNRVGFFSFYTIGICPRTDNPEVRLHLGILVGRMKGSFCSDFWDEDVSRTKCEIRKVKPDYSGALTEGGVHSCYNDLKDLSLNHQFDF